MKINKKLKRLLLLMFFCAPAFLQAQDFRKVIKEMREQYMQSGTLQIVMEITAHDSPESEPFYQQVVEIKRDGNKYWYQMDENEMMLNEKCLIAVNYRTRDITISPRDMQSEAELQKDFRFDLDSVLAQYESFKYMGKSGESDHYVVAEKKGEIEEIHFFIIPETFVLKELAYKYREGQYVSIRFMQFEKDVVFDADTFSEKRYVASVNNRVVPSGFFPSYRITSH